MYLLCSFVVGKFAEAYTAVPVNLHECSKHKRWPLYCLVVRLGTEKQNKQKMRRAWMVGQLARKSAIRTAKRSKNTIHLLLENGGQLKKASTVFSYLQSAKGPKVLTWVSDSAFWPFPLPCDRGVSNRQLRHTREQGSIRRHARKGDRGSLPFIMPWSPWGF